MKRRDRAAIARGALVGFAAGALFAVLLWGAAAALLLLA